MKFNIYLLNLLCCLLLLVACDSKNKNPDIDDPQITQFDSDSPIIFNQGQVTLSWSVSAKDEANTKVTLSADSIELDEEVVAKGSRSFSLSQTTEFLLTVVQDSQTIEQSIKVLYGTFSILQAQILQGQTTQLIWNIPDISQIRIEPDLGVLAPTGKLNISPLQPTAYTLSVDELGDNVTVVIDLDVQPVIAAALIANPLAGLSPLTVRFSPKVINNNQVVTNYAWDFTGDGIIDRSDKFGAPQTYSYTGNPGDTFEVFLTITSNIGNPLIAKQTITITNQAAVVQVASSNTNGHAPLLVNFTVDAQDPQGINTVSIDYEGDGSVDETQLGNAIVTGSWTFQTTYKIEGSFIAVVKVTDTAGAETIVTNNAITVDVNNPLDPIIQLSANPLSGNSPLTPTFTASAELFDGSTIAQWRWDLDGDGTFETQGGSESTDSIDFTYNGVDNYYPIVEVTTDSNRTAKASLRVATQLPSLPLLNIPDGTDTINSDTGEDAVINVTLPFETQFELWIEDALGARVKTLQPVQLTSAGSYSVSWDATDEQATTVTEGDYYAVLGYSTYGLQREIDLRTSTGGKLSYYRRTEANPRFFDRLEQPLRIDYAVDDPAEVSFFWQISFGDRLMTLMEHERMGRGQYSLYWNGEYPSGQKIPTNLSALMPGILRYTLPDNVIFVKENPRIDNFILNSTMLTDPRREPIGLTLTLSKASTIELVVSDMDKGVDVATRVYSDVAAGVQSLAWNGKNNDEQYLAPGDYRIGVRSVDERGNRSLFWYRTQRIDY